MRLSLKLGSLCAAVTLLPLLIISALVLSNISSYSRRKTLDNLQSNARAAAALYEKRLAELRAAAQQLADEIANRALVSSDATDQPNTGAWARLQNMLAGAQNDLGLDFLMVADPQGRLTAMHNNQPKPGETLLGGDDKNPVAERVISGGNLPQAFPVVERGDRYSRLGLSLVAPVHLQNGATVDEALVMEAGAPIFSGGRFVGVVIIGQMLNTYYKPRPGENNLQTPLVAEVRQTLYRGAEEDAGALIAYGDAIIASSIPAPPGEYRLDKTPGPALAGALRDPARGEETIQQGGRSYSVAWQPIRAADGSDIGAVGVARPAGESSGPTAPLRVMLIVVGAIAALLATAGGFLFGHTLASRVKELEQAASRWSVGELSAAAKDRDPMMAKWVPEFLSRDEITHLAEQLEQMRESFRQAIERLRKR
ncbi:MAG TPA: HAMP domain-containing protein [Blastocatellia bacterium]|nr:HAMP domain-containing protein [Blastocatellia bacterium]